MIMIGETKNLKYYFLDLCHVFVTDFQTIHSMILKNLILEKRIRYTSFDGMWLMGGYT